MKERIVTGTMGGILFLGFLYAGNLYFTLFTLLLGIIAYREYTNMMEIKPASFLFQAGLPMIASIYFLPVEKEILWFIGTSLFLLYFTFKKSDYSLEQVGMSLLGIAYIGFGFYSFSQVREEHEFLMALFPILIIWATDSGAYFVGKYLGKNKLAPVISPNKTIEGSVGGIVIGIITAFIFQLTTHFQSEWTSLLFITVFISIFTQMGDLMESALKRHYHIKDSGNILPGHGGILDRFDSLIFVMPFYYYIFIPFLTI